MKGILAGLLLAVLVLASLPLIAANDAGDSTGITFTTEQFVPRVWMCDHRSVIDDSIETGRVDGDEIFSEKIEQCSVALEACRTECESGAVSWCYSFDGGPSECWEFQQPLECQSFCFEVTKTWDCDILKGYELIERVENYAFAGEKVEWIVLVMDKNKIEEVVEVVATDGEDAQVECERVNSFASPGEQLKDYCNARIDEEELEAFDDQTMAFYECTLTVEPTMFGEDWVTVEAVDITGLSDTIDENEYWFFNPMVEIDILGNVNFGVVRPGTIAYADTIRVENVASPGSGVLLDMFISGTDFYDPSNSGARCVITNRLKLGNNYDASGLNWNNNKCKIGFKDTDDHLCYYASNGAYSTETDPRADAEGYVPIVYGDSFDTDFYNDAEVMQPLGPYYPGYQPGNILTPGAEIAVTFKLGLPEPCTGDFTDGELYFWAEAI